jgi:hypothetical protein
MLIIKVINNVEGRVPVQADLQIPLLLAVGLQILPRERPCRPFRGFITGGTIYIIPVGGIKSVRI